MTPTCYSSEWAEAIDRTIRFGLRVPAHQIEPTRRYLTDQRKAEFPHVMQSEFGELDFHEVVAQCIAIHYRLAPVIEQWLGCPALYTIGWVQIRDGNDLYKFDEAFIADKLRTGHSESKIGIHAWLTLPTMEVVDVALATTMALVHKVPDKYGAVLARYADGLDGMAYKPMLVGTDFLRKTGLLREWSVSW